MSSSPYARDLRSILAVLQESGNGQDHDLPEEEAVETIHVYPVEGGGILFTKTPMEPDAPVVDSEPSALQPAPYPTKSGAPPTLLSVVLIFLLLLLLDSADTALTALMTPTATITLLPSVQTITVQSIAQLGKLLSPITVSEGQTAPATGRGHQDARVATGAITFYNGELQQVVIPAGTIVTGRDGIQITTGADAIIPAADPTTNPPTFGRVTIAAQAVHVGSSGNISAYDLNQPCCVASVIAKNPAPFTGGQDARDYSVVSKSDIDTAAETLTGKVTLSMNAALQEQLQPTEQSKQLPCRRAVTADHRPGEEGTSVQITVSETCTAIAYDPQGLRDLATRLLTTQATKTLGTGYRLYGSAHVTVTQAALHASSPVVFLAFTGQGTYLYTLTGQAQQRIVTLVAGKPRLAALRILSRLPGIHRASISGIPDNQLLPDDPTHVHLLIVVTVY